MLEGKDILFEVETPIALRIRCSHEYWQIITVRKHPVMRDKLDEVKGCLGSPDEIRESRSDRSVYLFYKKMRSNRWICAVTKRLNGAGFLITTYITDAVKEGKNIWNR
ncbi:MAG: DUF4258 domain-containing protein [Ignavibacteriota bacterium]